MPPSTWTSKPSALERVAVDMADTSRGDIRYDTPSQCRRQKAEGERQNGGVESLRLLPFRLGFARAQVERLEGEGVVSFAAAQAGQAERQEALRLRPPGCGRRDLGVRRQARAKNFQGG